MIPALTAVYEELCRRASEEPNAARAAALRAAFFERCGRYDADHPAAELREAAAWEDALVGGGLGGELVEAFEDAGERQIARAIIGAHRGVFLIEQLGGVKVARDLWCQAEFVLNPADTVARAPGDEGDPMPCQGRIAATEHGGSILPGAIFHWAEARQEIERTLSTARAQRLETGAVLDALLRMEHAYQTLSRVKVRYAYRAEAL